MSHDLPEQFGRYRILRRLGQGGMGSVYLAEDTQLQRQVALKIPNLDSSDGPDILARFQREARVAATIHHPNLCPVYDVGIINGLHYLTMPFLEGQPLSAFINTEQPWQPFKAADVVRKIASALLLLHQHAIIHRDLKPHNIMLCVGEPILLDFGLARSYAAVSKKLSKSGGFTCVG